MVVLVDLGILGILMVGVVEVVGMEVVVEGGMNGGIVRLLLVVVMLAILPYVFSFSHLPLLTFIQFSTTIAERLTPTLNLAKSQAAKYERNARFLSLAINIALGLQVLVGALITGVAAAASPKGARISTTILGGTSTLVASFLARVRGSGEPEISKERARDLEKVCFVL